MATTVTTDLSFDTTAYNTLAWFDLRPELYFDSCADVKSTPQTHRGATVQFTIMADMAAQTTALTEDADVTPVTLDDNTATVTLVEQGATTKTTARLRNTSYIELNPSVASVVGFNAGISLDTIARAVLVGGSNVRYGGNATSRTTIGADDDVTSSHIRRIFAELSGASVMPFDGGFYRAYIHPDVAYDLKEETGDTGWREVHNQSLPEAIIRGTIGHYEGFHFVSTPRANIRTNASDGAGAAGNIDVYDTLFMGRQALAKAYTTSTHTDGQQMGPLPIVVPGPITDSLKRFVPLGWYWFGGYSIFRQAALRRLESASTIGANAS